MKLSVTEKFMARVHKTPDGCWQWKGAISPGGYGLFLFNGRRIFAHRASWILHRGEIPVALLVCHTCDVRYCVNPSHLFLGTPAMNAADARRKGRTSRGERKNSKLTADQVQQIRRLLMEDKMYMTEIGRQFGVASTTISSIKQGKIWVHLPWPDDLKGLTGIA